MRKRNGTEIQVFLKRKHIKQAEIAELAGVHRSSVARTISGERNNPQTLAALKAAGVPARFLG